MLDLRAINQSQFDTAKRNWLYANLAKTAIFVLGAVNVLIFKLSVYTPYAILILAVASEGFLLRSDAIKRKAETLLRSLDICRSFGRSISEADKRDIIFNVPSKQRHRFDQENVIDSYFAEVQSPGVYQAVRNLLESAWYTRKQARIMALVSSLVFLGALILSVCSLNVASHEIADLSTRDSISQFVTSWLLLLISLGVVRHGYGYYKLYSQSLQTEKNCEHLLSGEVHEADAIRLWYEYQVVRSSSPLLPDLLWRFVKSSLNDAWKRTVADRHDENVK